MRDGPAMGVEEGPERAGWEPRDRRASAGGRLYATAMSTLILQADRRMERLATWSTRG